MRSIKLSAALLCLALPFGALTACDEGTTDDAEAAPLQKGSSGSADSSLLAVVIDLKFSASVKANYCWSERQTIQDQLFYTIGQLNGMKGVGRLDRLELSNIKTAQSGSTCTITYDARLPVAWGNKSNVPKTIDLVLPLDNTTEGIDKFVETYLHSCAEAGAHDVDAGSFWYYFRPAQSACKFTDADVVRPKAAVSVSPVNTTGKYPEYNKIWEDNKLNIVAVFGKYEDGATSNDAGIDAFNSFAKMAQTELKNKGATVTTVPATIPTNPGPTTTELTINGALPGGKTVSITAFLVNSVDTMGADKNAKYETLSTRADLIVYNGHAGLGSNIRTLANKGKWVEGQYVIIFMNGCDSYAYIDQTLFEAHANVNPNDPDGTKTVDIVTNAMPSFFASMAGATSAIMRGLIAWDAPKTYEKIFADIDSAEIVIVTGEHDNTYVPGTGTGSTTPVAWTGIDEKGTLEKKADKRFTTPTLAAGKYRFALTGTKDIDLYVRLGNAPTYDLYDCRPYLDGSTETCDVTLPAPGVIHVLLNAYTGPANFRLVGSVR